MFEHHFGLRENPFVAGHHSRFVYPSPEHQEALAHLRFGIENREPFVLITGEVGTGKTTALYDALAEWQTRIVVALITNSALTRNELLEEISLRLGVLVTSSASKPQILSQLERTLTAIHSRGDRAILLLDEAQNLERELLEEIRLLSNLEIEGTKLLQIFLVGQPELESKLQRPELRQLRQRITVHYRLRPLNIEDTERYIHHRIGVAGGHALSIFPADACREVHRLTHGIPREINHVCSQALLNAFVEDARAVGPLHVASAATDIEFKSVIGDEDAPESIRAQLEATSPPSARPPVRAARMPAAPVPVAATTSEAPAPATPIEPPASAPAVTPRQETAPLAAPRFEAPAPGTPAPAPAPEPEPSPKPEPAAEAELNLSMIDTWMEHAKHPREGAAATPVVVELPEPVAETPVAAAAPEPHPVAVESSSAPRAAAATASPTSAPTTPPRRSLEDEQRVAALPPRLRDKLSAASHGSEPMERIGSGSRWMWFAAAAVVAVVGGLLFAKFGPSGTPHDAKREEPAPHAQGSAASASASARGPVVKADSVARATAAPGVTPVTHSTTPTPNPAAAPTVTQAPAAATTPRPAPAAHAFVAPVVAAAPAAPRVTYALSVATYLDPSRANSQRDQLAASTRMPVVVTEAMEDGASVYHLVLGTFPSRAAAEDAATDLILKGLVEEARVVTTHTRAKK
ncbi:MAG: AAA family ATPase [Candidatus Eisenbacteria bacterium]|nr:AAA family ATPase [Candidatus Eisenbacteria bacterium]